MTPVPFIQIQIVPFNSNEIPCGEAGMTYMTVALVLIGICTPMAIADEVDLQTCLEQLAAKQPERIETVKRRIAGINEWAEANSVSRTAKMAELKRLRSELEDAVAKKRPLLARLSIPPAIGEIGTIPDEKGELVARFEVGSRY